MVPGAELTVLMVTAEQDSRTEWRLELTGRSQHSSVPGTHPQSLVTPRDGLRIRAPLVILNQFLPVASQVLLLPISSMSVRCGLGLGVAGVEVAERKPPLEVGSSA